MPLIRLKWKTDLEKQVVILNFDRRGWLRIPNTNGVANGGHDESDWHFYWASVGTVKQIFHPDSGIRLSDMQIINHFPNHFELTRKDLMVKNIKRYYKEFQRDYPNFPVPDIIPPTYLLPADYSLIVEEFKKHSNAMWIMKPTSRSQGKGIFIVTKLQQIKKWSSSSGGSSSSSSSNAKSFSGNAGNSSAQTSSSSSSSSSSNANNANNSTREKEILKTEAYVISRYIDNPLLIGGKKFDLRIYVLVTSFRPLKAYLYTHGFARFCLAQYSHSLSDLDNPLVHLTNVAVQKHGDDYNDKHGGKWHVRNLRIFIEQAFGLEASNKLFYNMDQLIVHSLKSVQNVMINDRHCFECYGYDILIDSDLKPWLVEVNASPSLSTTTEEDRIIKLSLLRDIYNIVASGIPSHVPDTTKSLLQMSQQNLPSSTPQSLYGGFYVLYDEAYEQQEEENSNDPTGKRRFQSSNKIPGKAEWR